MPKSEAFNCDCMEYMKSLPNNAFDLAICDPPYGGGFTEGGGCQGWFSKYHQNDCSQSVQVERERERERARAATTDSGTPEADSSGTSGQTALYREKTVLDRNSGGVLTDQPGPGGPGPKNTAKKS